MIDIEKMKRAIRMMRKTGSDDGQYMLVRMRDLEELVDAWERDQVLQEWMREIVGAIGEVKNEENEYEYENEESTESSGESEDEKSDGFESGSEEDCAEEPDGPEDILPVS